jgi:hypothetical protein
VWQWRRRRPACAHGAAVTAEEEAGMCARYRAAAAEEEAGSSDINDSEGDRQSREHAAGT